MLGDLIIWIVKFFCIHDYDYKERIATRKYKKWKICRKCGRRKKL